MTDPRVADRALYARWLRVRAGVRALEHVLAAREHEAQRTVRRGDGAAELLPLVDRLHAERAAVAELARELDARIVGVKAACDTLEAAYVDALVANARRRAANAER